MPLMLTASGLVGATITVAATTMDDAIWLVPYVAASTARQEQRSWTMSARIVHAGLFVATLEFLALVSVVVAKIITKSAAAASSSSPTPSMHSSNRDRDITDSFETVADTNLEIMLGIIAALLCWSLALFFYIKKMLKRRRRQRRQEEERMGLTTATATNKDTTISYGTSTANDNNDHAPVDDSLFQQEEDEEEEEAPRKALSCSSIATVMSLTTLGAMDELSYFPALLVGKIFTPLEICLGTLLAAMTILTVVSCCLAKCQPLVDWLDQIPIYAVIAVFATILTLEVLYNIVMT